MKTIIFLLFINSFIFADSLLIRNTNLSTNIDCITEHYYKNARLFYRTSDNPTSLKRTKVSNYTSIEIKSGYIFTNNKCLINNKSLSEFNFDSSLAPTYNNLSVLGLSLNEFNLLMAFSGIITSFLFLFGLFRWI